MCSEKFDRCGAVLPPQSFCSISAAHGMCSPGKLSAFPHCLGVLRAISAWEFFKLSPGAKEIFLRDMTRRCPIGAFGGLETPRFEMYHFVAMLRRCVRVDHFQQAELRDDGCAVGAIIMVSFCLFVCLFIFCRLFKTHTIESENLVDLTLLLQGKTCRALTSARPRRCWSTNSAPRWRRGRRSTGPTTSPGASWMQGAPNCMSQGGYGCPSDARVCHPVFQGLVLFSFV